MDAVSFCPHRVKVKYDWSDVQKTEFQAQQQRFEVQVTKYCELEPYPTEKILDQNDAEVLHAQSEGNQSARSKSEGEEDESEEEEDGSEEEGEDARKDDELEALVLEALGGDLRLAAHLIPILRQNVKTWRNACDSQFYGERASVQSVFGMSDQEDPVEERLKLPSCAYCWDKKRKCMRDATNLQCRDCGSDNKQYKLDACPAGDEEHMDWKVARTRPYRDWKPVIPNQENKRKVLRVLIKNKEHIACPDSGSERNIISEAFAKENGLVVTQSSRDIEQFQLGCGKRIWSIGRVRMTVELLGKTLPRKLRWFYVLATCPVPLILGMPFLSEAEILTKNRHMLETCPIEFSNVSSLLWIGSPRKQRRPPCNRMKCTLDGRKLTATADTGSDLNFMSQTCAKREGFHVDTREEARMIVQVGDGTFAETIGQVYIHDLSLDWRKPVTEPHQHARTAPAEPSSANGEQPVFLGTIFHVLPRLPCDVILGRDILDETDAFNHCQDLSCARTTSSKRPFELNIIISGRKWTWKRKRAEPVLDAKEEHDNKRHEEIYRRSKRADEILLLAGDERDRAKVIEDALCREWDARHATCTDCHPPNLV